jgi:hypothetical protein
MFIYQRVKQKRFGKSALGGFLPWISPSISVQGVQGAGWKGLFRAKEPQ